MQVKRTYVEPPPEHPGPVLFQLEFLDVDVSKDHRHDERNPDNSDTRLRFEGAPESVPRGHEGPNCADHRQQEDNIAVNPMDEYKLVSNCRHKLENDKEPRR